MIKFLLVFFIFEFLLLPVKYLLNDMRDAEGDAKRGARWEKPVDIMVYRKLLNNLINLRIFISLALIFIIHPWLLAVAVSLLALQYLYDLAVRDKYPILSLIIVAIGYPLRSLSIIFFFGIILDLQAVLLLTALFINSFYLALDWRLTESYFLKQNKAEFKKTTEFFLNPKFEFFKNTTLVIYLSILACTLVALFNQIELSSYVLGIGLAFLSFGLWIFLDHLKFHLFLASFCLLILGYDLSAIIILANLLILIFAKGNNSFKNSYFKGTA